MDWGIIVGTLSAVASAVALFFAGRANQIAKQANRHAETQLQIDHESLAVAREAHGLAKEAHERAEDAHLIHQRADADRALYEWVLEAPQGSPWVVRLRENGPDVPREVSAWLILDEQHKVEGPKGHDAVEEVSFDIEEVLAQMVRDSGRDVEREPIRVACAAWVSWRGASGKVFTTKLEDHIDYPRPMPLLVI